MLLSSSTLVGFSFLLSTVSAASPPPPDWLVRKVTVPSTVAAEDDGELVLTNGLLTRRFALGRPGFFTSDFYSHEKRSSILRALGPEAVVALDGVEFNVGGVNSSLVDRAYLNRTQLREGDLRPDPLSFQFSGYSSRPIKERYPYRPKRGAPTDVPWPPRGVHLRLDFRAPKGSPRKFKGVLVRVHYELYEGAPVLAKWVTVRPQSEEAEAVRVSVKVVEVLNVNQQWASEGAGTYGYGWLWVESDEPHGTKVIWDREKADNLPGAFVPRVTCAYDRDYSVSLGKAGEFASFRVLELAAGSADRERVGMARRRMLRMLAPQTSENPIYFHTMQPDSKSFRKLVDQLSEVGFEMVFYSFWSGWNLEDNSTDFLPNLRDDIRYANSKGIEVGGYDLIALTRRVRSAWAATDETGGESGSACFASGWYDHLLERVVEVATSANLTALETDGPYGGYPCHSTAHAHHEDGRDSVYWQNKLQGDFFRKLREMEVYINQPDTYFYHGGSKTGMGYNEGQYSLPRWTDLSVSRQGMFDDTFHYTPTVGWMFLPILNYGGGGDEAKFEPLSRNLEAYEWGLAQYLGSGVAACYRGDAPFDGDETRGVVKKWIDFYKKYRPILTSDVVHVRRADMQGVDCILHVNPNLEVRGLAMVFNPTDEEVRSEPLRLPLYYSGLEDGATLEWEDGKEEDAILDREYGITVDIDLKPRGITWIVIREAAPKQETNEIS